VHNAPARPLTQKKDNKPKRRLAKAAPHRHVMNVNDINIRWISFPNSPNPQSTLVSSHVGVCTHKLNRDMLANILYCTVLRSPQAAGSTPSSIFVGMPPPKPCDADASNRAIFALCESALRPWGDRCWFWIIDLATAP